MEEFSINWALKCCTGIPAQIIHSQTPTDHSIPNPHHIAIKALNDTLNALASNEYIWVHLNYDHIHSKELLLALGVTAEGSDALLMTESRPKSMLIGDAWLMILRAINKNTENHPELMVSVRLWITPQLIITMRRAKWPLQSIRDLKQLVESEDAPSSPILCALQLADNLTLRVKETVDTLEDGIAELEAGQQSQGFQEVRELLSSKRREASSIRRFLMPQREALEGLARHKGVLDEDGGYRVRDLVERTTRYIEDLDLVREKAMVLQDDLRATISDEQNQRMYVLSIVTSIFLPLSFLTGMFGMNVAGMPGTELMAAFWLVTSSMVVLAVLIAVVMRIKGWF